jgi:hypothetical protein
MVVTWLEKHLRSVGERYVRVRQLPVAALLTDVAYRLDEEQVTVHSRVVVGESPAVSSSRGYFTEDSGTGGVILGHLYAGTYR